MYKRLAPVMIGLNFFWSFCAVIYDSEAIIAIPFYLWPFIIICPIYPFFLGLLWLDIRHGRKSNQLILAIATIPSVAYLIASLIYYPTWMIQNNFEWLSIGQIFWVAFYGIQGLYFLYIYRIDRLYLYLIVFFLTLSFSVQYMTRTFGYQNFSNMNNSLLLMEYAVLELCLLIILVLNLHKNLPKTRRRKAPAFF